ncbi:MAG: hypothetical protein IJZ88_00650 [Clostridia bacterium]|nr:hypothetical protein [Clostridia bacterium]
MKEKMYILTYEHGGYVLWEKEVKPRLKKINEWLEKYPKLRIGLDYESFAFDEFSRCDPEVVEMIGDLLKKYPDRVGLGATTYGQPLALTISEESNARQLSYAVKTNLDYYGVTPSVYAISEFALHNQTPQLIAQCGYKGALLRSHVMGYGYPRTFDSAWGRWIGKDLTEIPAVPTYDEQGRGFNCTTLDNWIISRWSEDHAGYDLEDFEKKFRKYSPLLASRYDDLTQPIERLTEYIETKDNYEYVLLEDIPTLYGEAKDELKTTDNDFHVQMPWGYCGNEIFNGCRQGEVEAVQAEKLNTLSVLLGGKSLQKENEDAWKYILAAEHHDVTICGLLDLSRRFIPESLSNSDFVKKESLKVISSRFAHKDGDSLVVINPHSFAISEWVEVTVTKEVCAFDGDTAIKCEIVNNDGSLILRAFADVPAFSAKSFILKEVKPESKSDFCWNKETGLLKTPKYTLKLNEKGIVYIDAENGRIVDNGEGNLLRAWVEEKECYSKGEWEVTVNAHSAIAVQRGDIGGIPFSIEMKFADGCDRIDCKTKFEMHGEHVGRTDITEGKPAPLTVNGHHHEDKLCFVMNACLENNRKLVRDLPYSISEWDSQLRKTEEYWYPGDKIILDEVVSAEEAFNNYTYMQGIYWVALRDSEKGISVFNRGCMGSAIKGNEVAIPLIYSNPYLCGTRILDGIYDDEFSVVPFTADISDAELHRKAMNYEYTPTATIAEKGNGDMTAYKIADFDSQGGEVILTTIYPEDGAILARFCNFSDEKAVAEFKPTTGTLTHETDLLGNNTAPVNDNKLSFRPWEVKTVKIEL